MSKQGASFSGSSLMATSVRHPSDRRELSLVLVSKVRSRWPFKVEAAYGAHGLHPADSALVGRQGRSSFVT